MINISEKMKELIPLLWRGINDVEIPDVRPECEDEWSPDYAIVQDVYWIEESRYFDEPQFISDLREYLKRHFACDGENVVCVIGMDETTEDLGAIIIRFYIQSQEIEVYRVKEDQNV